MAGYNFNFNIPGHHASDDTSFLGAAPSAPVMNQSADWIAPGYPPLGVVGGNIAAPPHPELDSAPFVAAGSGGGHTRGQYTQETSSSSSPCHTRVRASSGLEENGRSERHRPFLCTCGKSYTRLFSLNRHLKKVTEPQQYQCPWCENPSVYTCKEDVEAHLRSIHQVCKKTAIDALLRPQKAATRKDSRRRNAGDALTSTAGPPTAAPYAPATTSSLSAPFPVQGPVGPAGLPNFPIGGFHHASGPGLFHVPAAAAVPTGFPFLPPSMGYSVAGMGMTGSVAAPGAEAAFDMTGVDFLDGVDFVNGMWLQ
ncbi:hypothetical protein VMCG_03732 [Cytospora schulzeri]|uniref:C2H2-type domain-containing protein n=1 Tax=Cytospora schulzeri TaxID=448051 RepID=A0A423WVL3_9PEZI|nr:hypothetical protein VMCG_03732 [Valsa malicola]